jgi:hypothetical protein
MIEPTGEITGSADPATYEEDAPAFFPTIGEEAPNGDEPQDAPEREGS